MDCNTKCDAILFGGLNLLYIVFSMSNIIDSLYPKALKYLEFFDGFLSRKQKVDEEIQENKGFWKIFKTS